MSTTTRVEFDRAPRRRSAPFDHKSSRWYGVALFCAMALAVFAVGAQMGVLGQPLEQDMMFAAP